MSMAFQYNVIFLNNSESVTSRFCYRDFFIYQKNSEKFCAKKSQNQVQKKFGFKFDSFKNNPSDI